MATRLSSKVQHPIVLSDTVAQANGGHIESTCPSTRTKSHPSQLLSMVE